MASLIYYTIFRVQTIEALSHRSLGKALWFREAPNLLLCASYEWLLWQEVASDFASHIHSICCDNSASRSSAIAVSGMVTFVILEPITSRIRVKGYSDRTWRKDKEKKDEKEEKEEEKKEGGTGLSSRGQDTCLLERSWPPFRSYTFANSLHFLCPLSFFSFSSIPPLVASRLPPPPPLFARSFSSSVYNSFVTPFST